MTDCASRADALTELVFGALDDEAAIELQLHLETCEACRAEERRLLALREDLRAADTTLDPALRARVRAAWAGAAPATGARVWSRPVPLWAALTACVALALLVAMLPRDGRLPERTARAPRRPAPATLQEAPLPFAAAGAFDTRAWRDSGGVAPRRAAGPGRSRSDSL